ncbi:MAG: secretin N-terminal domain-containing protein [Candidatus Hodarchaeota archaeon]
MKAQIRYCFLIGIVLFCFCAVLIQNISLAQQEQLQPEENLPLPPQMKEGHITVDFKDANIHDVLKIISYKSGVNIVAGKDVTGTVTIRLVDVPWERTLDVILKNNGFVYEREEGIIRVTTVENLSKEELSTQVFILNYAKAEEVSESVKEILSERGKIKFDDRTNQVVVTDVPSNLYKISKVIEKLDKKTAQIAIEARLIETVLDDDERLGIDWGLGNTTTPVISGSSRPTVAPFSFQKTYPRNSSNGALKGKCYVVCQKTVTRFPIQANTPSTKRPSENGFKPTMKKALTA